MENQWSLDHLYTSFDAPELKEDLKRIEESIVQLMDVTGSRLASTNINPEDILHYFSLMNELLAKLDKISNFANLKNSVNTKDIVALNWIEKVESFSPKIVLIEAAFKRYLKRIENLDEFIKTHEDLNEFAFTLCFEKNLSSYLLSDEEEALLSEMKNTGSNAWSKLHDIALSSLMVDYDGEEVPISIVRNHAYSFDSTTRKKAYEAELKAYEKIDQASASCLNAIKGEVLMISKKRGYASPLDMTLVHSRMDHVTLDAMFSAIKEKLPVFRKYLQKKAALLGHKGKLPFYDLFAPVGEIDMTFTYNEAKDFIVENFGSFSKELGAYAKRAFEENWIDPFPKEGKVGGAFCTNIHAIKESRILSNFTGTFNDVSTLAHELGHGYHGECLKDALFNNSNYPMPLAETASIFAETLVVNAALKKATKEQALLILENDISSATQVIVDIYSRYLFETELFERRKEASLSVSDLKEMMKDAQRKAYGDGLDENFLHPYMWVVKPHYYDADFNFYNFPYAFGILFAKGLYAKYLEDQEAFIPKYDALLTATGKNNIHDVLATMDIDSHSVSFFRSSLELIEKDIAYFLTL